MHLTSVKETIALHDALREDRGRARSPPDGVQSWAESPGTDRAQGGQQKTTHQTKDSPASWKTTANGALYKNRTTTAQEAESSLEDRQTALVAGNFCSQDLGPHEEMLKVLVVL